MKCESLGPPVVLSSVTKLETRSLKTIMGDRIKTILSGKRVRTSTWVDYVEFQTVEPIWLKPIEGKFNPREKVKIVEIPGYTLYGVSAECLEETGYYKCHMDHFVVSS